MPSDVTGVSVFSPDTGSWDFRPGPVFAHVVLVDELNRTPPRTQSALLETMEEQQVSVDGQIWPLPRPHLVIATQNPRSQRGTFPLVESQLDRFAIATSIGYPDAANEAQLARQQAGKFALAGLAPVCTTERLAGGPGGDRVRTRDPGGRPVCRRAVPGHPVRPGGAARRQPPGRHLADPLRPGPRRTVRHGVSWRPDDVKAVAIGCLAHRLITDEGDDAYGAALHVVRRHSRGDRHPTTMSRGFRNPRVRPAPPLAPIAITLAILVAWWLVAHNSGAGWVQALGDVAFGTLVIGIFGPAVVAARARVRVSAPARRHGRATGGGRRAKPPAGFGSARSSRRAGELSSVRPESGDRGPDAVTLVPIRRGAHDRSSWTSRPPPLSPCNGGPAGWSCPCPPPLHVAPRRGQTRAAGLPIATIRPATAASG